MGSKEQIVADALEWLKWLKGRQDPQTKLLRDLTILASEALSAGGKDETPRL